MLSSLVLYAVMLRRCRAEIEFDDPVPPVAFPECPNELAADLTIRAGDQDGCHRSKRGCGKGSGWRGNTYCVMTRIVSQRAYELNEI